ncbi:hypothetical protein CASFOL_034201 [Castilleja foliolosa]|uniref:Uncharacterized protein n=1 Tax=Castilleja foliolosa TaxID=1961234 RepID=A0ABD3BWW4_9LAMI
MVQRFTGGPAAVSRDPGGGVRGLSFMVHIAEATAIAGEWQVAAASDGALAQ